MNLFPTIVAAGLALCGMGFYVLCLWSARAFLRSSRKPAPVFTPPVSILKPLRGVDPQMYESFRSHCVQDYPEYEIIFGGSEADDPAVEAVREPRRGSPTGDIQLVVCRRASG